MVSNGSTTAPFTASPDAARAPAVRRTPFGTSRGGSVAAVPKGSVGVQGETRLLLVGGAGVTNTRESSLQSPTSGALT